MKADFQSSPLFLDLSDAEMAALADVMIERRMEEGATLFVESMPGESMYLIEMGTVKISKMLSEGEEKTLAVLGPQDYFGEMALFESAPRAVTARVLKPATLWSMKKADYDKLVEKYPVLAAKLMRNIMRVFAQRIRTSNQEIKDLICWGGAHKV